MIRRCNLPDEITLPGGAVLKPVIGGHIGQKPFLTVEGAGVDVTKNGWMTSAVINDPDPERWQRKQIIAEAKRQRRKFRVVSVLSRNLRGKLDLYHRPYTGSVWVFVEVRP
jgi:hypothetical protein